MRVLHVIPSLSPKRGGPSFAVRLMAEAAARQGGAVDVAATDDDGAGHLATPLEQPVVEGGVTYRYFRRQTDFYTFSWPLTRWLARHVGDYDLIHVHGLFSYSTLPAAWLAWRADVPYLVRPFGTLNRWGREHRRPLLKKASLRLLEGPILERAAYVHYTCEQERIEAEMAGCRYPAIVLPLGIDLTPFSSLLPAEALRRRHPQLKGKPVILFLSRLHPIKGLDILLQAMADLVVGYPNACLFLVGDGEPAYMSKLQAQAEALGLVERIVWTGPLYGHDKLAAFAAADLFILPSYSENFGLAAVEALAAGLPLVISDQVGIQRDVARAEAGLVTPCNSEALAQAIGAMLASPELRARCAANARRLAEQQFSSSNMATALVALYHEVISSASRSRTEAP
jgi:glycosyltransferase involved in cell wall biosynthesis